MWPFSSRTPSVRMRMHSTKPLPTRRSSLGFVRSVWAACEQVLYAVGRFVLSPAVVMGQVLEALWLGFVKEVARTVASVSRRAEHLSFRSSVASLLLFLLLLSSATVGFRSVVLLADGVALKDLVVGEAQDAVHFMEQGKDQLAAEQYDAAGAAFASALQRFESARGTIAGSDAFIQTLVHLTPYGKDGERLIAAGTSAGKAAVALTDFLATAKQFSFGAQGITAATPGVEFAVVAERFAAVKQTVEETNALLSQVGAAHIPPAYADTFQTLQAQLDALTGSVRILNDAIRLLSRFATGDQRIVVLLQNSNELRPSGGFLGTYGAFAVHDGRITQQTVSSMYDIDGQLQTVYQPPLPVRAVNTRWYVRDANWFASFPESAAAVSGMYAEVTHVTPDLVIAITPAMAVAGLRLTGPVALPGYDTPLDADNFVEVTQVETSVAYDRTENKPKKMLGVFLPIFLDKLAAVAQAQPGAFLSYLTQALRAKDVLLYAPTPDAQGLISSLGFGGAIVPAARDYLGIVSANLGGTKTDLSLEQDAVLTTQVEADGGVVNTLTLHRRNPLPHTPGLENKSFVRILVPLGSELLSATGFSTVDLGAPTTELGTEHPQVHDWQEHAVTSLAHGTMVGTEAGKTFFGNWIVLSGGEEATVTLSWKLPFRITTLDRYSLIVQKQPGAVPYALRQELEIPGRRVLWATDEVAAVGSVHHEWSVSQDVFFGAVLGTQ